MPLTEVGDRVAPLAGAIVVPDQLASRDQVAAGPRDAHEQLRRLGKPDSDGLVEQPHPGGVVTLVHRGDSLGRQAEDLELGDAVPAARVQRLRCQFPGPGWVFLDDERCRVNGDPAMIRTLFHLSQQPVSALQPPAGHRGLVAELQMVRGQPSGHPGCRRGVTLLDVAPVGPLTRPEGQLSVIEAIATPAQSLQAIRCLLLGQRRLEQRPRPGPVTLAKRLPAGLQRP